jgi:hypothetical protein
METIPLALKPQFDEALYAALDRRSSTLMAASLGKHKVSF